MAKPVEDCFYDCQSDSESSEDLEDNNQGDQVLRAVGGYSGNHRFFPQFDDFVQMRHALERVTKLSRLFLRSVGGKCDSSSHLDKETSRSFFYPAQLEICARLITDKTCPIPPNAQCRLRGDPVKLKLPMELNPYSGQVHLPIFQPGSKNVSGICCPLEGWGDRQFGSKPAAKAGKESGLGYFDVLQRTSVGIGSGSVTRRHTARHDGIKKSGRKVRWPDVL